MIGLNQALKIFFKAIHYLMENAKYFCTVSCSVWIYKSKLSPKLRAGSMGLHRTGKCPVLSVEGEQQDCVWAVLSVKDTGVQSTLLWLLCCPFREVNILCQCWYLEFALCVWTALAALVLNNHLKECKDICLPLLGCQMKLRWLRRLCQLCAEPCSVVGSTPRQLRNATLPIPLLRGFLQQMLQLPLGILFPHLCSRVTPKGSLWGEGGLFCAKGLP